MIVADLLDTSRWVVGFVGRGLLDIGEHNKTSDGSDQIKDGDSEGGEVEAEKGMIWVKIFVSMIVCVEILIFGLLPAFGGRYIHVSDRIKALFVGLSNAFAGGVFLGGALVHLLGESAETFASLFPDNDNATAIVCTFAGVGYLLVFFLERVVLASHHADAHSHDLSGHSHKKSKSHSHKHKNDKHVNQESQDAVLVANDSIGTKQTESEATDEETSVAIEMETYHTSPDSTVTTNVETSGQSNEEEQSRVASFALTAVLSLHTFISGLALSLQTSYKTIFGLGLAIALHKWVEAFALGISMHRLEVPIKRRVTLIVLYSLATPFGMALGALLAMAFIHTDKVMSMTEAIGGAVASGTFLYVASVDILAEEFADPQDKWSKSFACASGFALMSMLKFVLD